MKFYKRHGVYILGILASVLVLLTLVIPIIIKNKTISILEAMTGRITRIESVAFNPFILTAHVKGFKLLEKNSSHPFLAFSSASVSLSPASLYRRALIIREARITAPLIRIQRIAPNSYNFSDLLQSKTEKKSEFRFSINNISITNGSVDFDDRGLVTEKYHAVRKIQITLPFISNIPYLADHYVAPRIEAIINGSPFSFAGKMKPFVQGSEVSFGTKLTRVNVPYYLTYVPTQLPIRLDSGFLDTNIDVSYRISATHKPEIEVKGDIILTDFRVREPDGKPLINFRTANVDIVRGKIVARDFLFSALTLDGIELFLNRDRQGRWNVNQLTIDNKLSNKSLVQKTGENTKEISPGESKLRLRIARTNMQGAQIHLRDDQPPGSFVTDLTDFSLNINNISTIEGEKTGFKLTFTSKRAEKFSAQGEAEIAAQKVAAGLTVAGVKFESYYPYLSNLLASPVKGTLTTLDASISYNHTTGFSLENGNLLVTGLNAPFTGKDSLKMAFLGITGCSYNQQQNKLGINGVTSKGAVVTISRDENGSLSPHSLIRKKPSVPKLSQEPTGTTTPLHYRIRSLMGSDWAVNFTDNTRPANPSFNIKNLNFTIGNIAGPTSSQISYHLACRYGDDGNIKATGNIVPTPFRLQGKYRLQRIPLNDFDAYLPESVNVYLADGALDTSLDVILTKNNDGLAGTFQGELGIHSFYCLDKADQEDLLKWESLQFDGIRGSLEPFNLSINEVALSNFYSKITVDKDGTLNLQRLITRNNTQPTETVPVATPTTAAVATHQESPKPGKQTNTIKIGAVTIQGGVLAFTDHHMSPEYATTFMNLGGRISGLSSEENMFADVDLRGNLENHSPLRITGKINPLRDDLFVDMKISFTDIELSPLTPYAGTYLGYSVDKGKLFLDLKYHIEKKELASENKLFLDQFTFGSKVDSKKSVNLPVRLAVALLKDRNGQIHLDLPVSGRTDDPKFSIWGVVWQMIRNIFVKAATAPFSLLQAMVGGKEEFSTVPFAYGSAILSQPEQEKLAKLAQALTDRPGIKIEIMPFVDRERDPEGYRNEVLLKKMKGEKFLVLVKNKKNLPGQTQESLEILPEETNTLLQSVYSKEKFPKPRNILGMVKELPVDEMRKLILTNTIAGEQQLQTLARERAKVVRMFLIEQGKIDTGRLFEKSGDIFKKSEKGGTARVEFGMAE